MTKPILVIGESCLDVFVYCDALRLAPDVPVPVLTSLDTRMNPGMAMNVQRNIESILGECDVSTNPNWMEITKTRYVHKLTNHTFVRVDSPSKMTRLDINTLNLKDYEIIAISDYNKGFLTEDDILEISKQHKKVFLDSKKPIGEWARFVKYIKINNYEYERSKSNLTEELEDKIIHTHGEEGAFFRGNQYEVEKVDVKDASGAGDTFMAALVSEFLKSEDIEKSIKFANDCASKIVQIKGVSVIKL